MSSRVGEEMSIANYKLDGTKADAWPYGAVCCRKTIGISQSRDGVYRDCAGHQTLPAVDNLGFGFYSKGPGYRHFAHLLKR